MAKLTIITGQDRGRVIELGNVDREIVIGRESCDIVLADAAVSRKHTQILCQQGQFVLADCGSSNGTFLNDKRISDTRVLKHNDQVRCGSTVLLFESEEHAVENKTGEAGELTPTSAETMVGLTVGELVSKSSARQREQVARAGLQALNISHGIKNLLQAVAGGREVVDHALKINDIERARRGWAILNDNLDRINRLVVNLLRFSKESTLQFKACPLNHLIESIVEAVRPEADKRGVVVSLHTDDRIETVEIDPDRVSEVVQNLILNALEALEGVRGLIEINTEFDEPAGHVLIKVIDNGPGIEDTKAIFEPFHTTRTKTGTGLGLAIAKKVIEQHGGKIEVESKPGKGATFVVFLPVERRRDGK